tara:strand:- start:467 stop:703 length:237 start_codon:yes stop_codon:yes gene_type:complete
MTLKEKAIELVNKFLQIYDGRVPKAKQCALICIDEILESNEKISLKDLSETMQTNDILCQLTDNAMYWQEVKQEINKL